MAESMRPGWRHPLCTCPELTFAMIEKGSAPDRSKCAGGAIAHPVLTKEDVRALARQLGLDE